MPHDFYVKPDGDLVIEAIVRSQSVKRWHMIDTTRTQSIAEHSANVALLAYYISISSPEGYFGSPAAAALAGLLHDLPEAFTGDIPSHTKKELEGIDELEHHLIPKLLEREIDEKLAGLIKLCDLAEGIRFIQVHGDDRTARWARAGLHKQLTDRGVALMDEWPRHVFDHVVAKIDYYIHEA